MVTKGNGKTYPVYIAKNTRKLKRRCTASNHVTGIQCGNPPLPGLDVCFHHGGRLPAVKEKSNRLLEEARQRLIAELGPTVDRLKEIRDQDDHMPSALGASVQIINRTLGKPGEDESRKGAGKMTIKIGVAIGVKKDPAQPALPEPSVDGVVIDRE